MIKKGNGSTREISVLALKDRIVKQKTFKKGETRLETKDIPCQTFRQTGDTTQETHRYTTRKTIKKTRHTRIEPIIYFGGKNGNSLYHATRRSSS